MSMGNLDRRAFLRQTAALVAAGAASTLWTPSWARREAWARTRDVVAFPAGTTYERTILPASKQLYTHLREGPGWPLIVREDLANARGNRDLRREPLASILHLTDVQVPDAQSPARTEWLSRYIDQFRAAWRPHETVVNHISEAAVRSSRQVGRGPVTGRPYDFAVSTGDNIDNMQANELLWFLRLLDGGELIPNSGGPGYDGVQSYWRQPQLPSDLFPGGYDDFYWRPDEAPASFWPDLFKADHGYPDLNGFLGAAVAPFMAQGLGIPWYSMYGNHDGLVQGNVAKNDLFQGIATGQIAAGIPGWPFPGAGPKLVGFPPGYDWSEAGAQQLFNDLLTGQLDPVALLGAPALPVPADVGRRLIGPHEYVRKHWEWSPQGEPFGHGFTEDNLGDGDVDTTLYYSFRPVDDAPILGIALDSTNRLGGAAGSIGSRQLAWLEQQLEAVHSRWYGPDGRPRRGRNEDHLVMVFAHHNIATMTNGAPSPDDPVRILGPQLEDVLLRYPNVIAFVNGHSHVNRVWAHGDRRGIGGGFWEIATSAQLDYPMQTRVIELVDNGDRTLSLFCSLIDQGGPADAREVFGPGDDYTLLELASYGRELAYNDFRDHANHPDLFTHRVGTPADRNVELLVMAPFPVHAGRPAPQAGARVPAHAGG
jgi:metallophosphoesterase (TIGR03767 family)